MNAPRYDRWFVLFGLLAVIGLGFAVPNAEASGCHGYGYSYASYSPNYCYTPTYCAYPNYPSYGACYDYSCYWPAFQPYYSYDCYGRPYVAWQSGYNAVR